jgi:6,7-dimethyl-8-ribityllumazine synthase
MRMLEGQLIARDVRIVILAARFNELIVRSLVDGAVDALKRHGAADADIHIVRVPGAFELPLAAQRLAKLRKYDGIAALGAVILNRVSLEYGVPVGFGVLTTDTMDQAMDRAGGKAGNKGADAVLATLEMVNLLRQLEA